MVHYFVSYANRELPMISIIYANMNYSAISASFVLHFLNRPSVTNKVLSLSGLSSILLVSVWCTCFFIQKNIVLLTGFIENTNHSHAKQKNKVCLSIFLRIAACTTTCTNHLWGYNLFREFRATYHASQLTLHACRKLYFCQCEWIQQ